MHYLVSGRVQGVSFRVFTRRAAIARGLSGWVRNLADGSVEVLACGEAAQLESLHQWLWQGPPQARVSLVQYSTRPEQDHYSGFEIR